mmetsp:Transcript_59006/g.117227  ORF Transcript_59006/g.117227 Transcript_59006/m.117227 type:complete len:242 (-) Transcript_59006:519-1244(-)
MSRLRSSTARGLSCGRSTLSRLRRPFRRTSSSRCSGLTPFSVPSASSPSLPTSSTFTLWTRTRCARRPTSRSMTTTRPIGLSLHTCATPFASTWALRPLARLFSVLRLPSSSYAPSWCGSSRQRTLTHCSRWWHTVCSASSVASASRSSSSTRTPSCTSSLRTSASAQAAAAPSASSRHILPRLRSIPPCKSYSRSFNQLPRPSRASLSPTSLWSTFQLRAPSQPMRQVSWSCCWQSSSSR